MYLYLRWMEEANMKLNIYVMTHVGFLYLMMEINFKR